jgi:crotonobetainyl-CoA:carnitine CoA-transferase CaiB-like acyl-CoA transferase
VLVYNDKQWRTFLEAVGRTDLLQDARFFPHSARARHIGEIYDFLDELLRTRSTSEWVELLERADIPVAPVNSVEDLIRDPHLEQSAFFGHEAHPTEGDMLVPRTPTAWSATPPQAPGPAPRLGQHSAQILRELGYSAEQIAALARSGVTLLAE